MTAETDTIKTEYQTELRECIHLHDLIRDRVESSEKIQT